MAELDFDDEFDDDGFGDDTPVADVPEVTEQPSGFLTRRRLIIIGAVLGVVFLISIGLFALQRSGSNKPKQISTQSIQKSEPVQPEKKKDKRKSRKKLKYAKLYDLEAAVAGDVLRELSFSEIPFKTEQRGKNFVISVDENRLEESLNMLATKGLPESTARGFALLDDTQTLGVTEFDKRVRFIRALAGEMEKAIIQFEDIETVKVQIVLPEQRLFAVTQPPVTASVLVRKVPGADLTDDVVFSIIQLVASSVENLQPENVSVIDTEGKVLSEGIFERMALKEAGLIAKKEPKKPKVEVIDDEFLPSPDKGGPVVPDYASIREWYQIKNEYEKQLEEKVTKQLIGVLPPGSYKVAVTAEIGPVDNGDVLDVRLLTTSIVVDESREDIFLDDDLKQEVFNTVAGAIGYVSGRDSILLSLGDFNQLTNAARRELRKQTGGSGFAFKLPSRFVMLPLIPVLAAAGFFGYRRFRRGRVPSAASEGGATDTLGAAPTDADFDGLRDEMDDERRFEEVRQFADTNPEALARIIEGWLDEDGAGDTVPEFEEALG